MNKRLALTYISAPQTAAKRDVTRMMFVVDGDYYKYTFNRKTAFYAPKSKPPVSFQYELSIRKA